MSQTPNVPKRMRSVPTFTIPALLALAGFTAVGLILVEKERTQVRDQAEILLPAEAPGFLNSVPGSAFSQESKPKPVRSRSVPASSFTPTQALVEVKPNYPRLAKLTRVQGPVEVDLYVDAAGRPVQSTVLSGNSALRGEALKAAQGWKFTPAYLNGRAVPSDFRIRFEFRLS